MAVLYIYCFYLGLSQLRDKVEGLGHCSFLPAPPAEVSSTCSRAGSYASAEAPTPETMSMIIIKRSCAISRTTEEHSRERNMCLPETASQPCTPIAKSCGNSAQESHR